MLQNRAYVQLQIIHFLNLQCNMSLTPSPSAIAERLVIFLGIKPVAHGEIKLK